MPVAARAEDRSAAIAQNCTYIKTVIDTLQRQDLVARTNRGREYENIKKQLNAFTDRVRHNKMASQKFDQALAEYSQATTAFREGYIVHDDKINALQQVDCKAKPGDFAAQLDAVRITRKALADSTARIDAAIANYRLAVVELGDKLAQAGVQ